MPEKLKISLGEVQKTLLLPLWGRALETKSQNPLIRDPMACEIVGRLDFDFDDMTRRVPMQLRINSAIRAFHFDAALRQFIAECPDATVVNIGAGLDTTFFRVDNGKIFWYDLDLPDTMALRRGLIPEGERNRCIVKSVFDRAWFNDVAVRRSKVFFMAAGVFFYLKEDDIRRLFLDLIDEFPGSQIMFEAYSKFMLRIRNRTIKKQRDASPFLAAAQWAAGSSAPIAKWSPRIKVIDDFPYYSRVDMARHWDKKLLFPLRVIHFLNGVRMVRLGLG